MKIYQDLFLGISIIPVLLIMPSFAVTTIFEETTYQDAYIANNQSGDSSGGAIHVISGPLTFNSTATFTENSSTSYGGAIMSDHTGTNADIIFNNAALFSNNFAENGGAIYSQGNITFNSNATFSNNYATENIGAFASGFSDKTTLFQGITIFSNNGVNNGNVITQTSGALGNVGTMIFANTAKFDGNGASVSGAAIGNSGTLIFQKGIIVQNSVGSALGAIASEGNLFIYGGNIELNNNVGAEGMGLRLSGESLALLGAYKDGDNIITAPVNNIIISGNTSTSSGAGLKLNDNGAVAELYANNIKFNQNTSNGNYGGAIFNAGDLSIYGANNLFFGNISNATTTDTENKKYYQYGGGAIQNRGNTGTATLIIGTENSQNTFTNNTSNQHGGAIYARAIDGTGQDSVITINGATSTFNRNNAGYNGGAIANYTGFTTGGNATIVINSDANFSGNTAGGLGGAIYNNDTITFNGITTFTDNTDSTGANDIYNDGTITFNNNATLNGGITGSGTLVVATGQTLNIGTANIYQGTMTLDGTLIATLTEGNSQINISNTFAGNGSVNLALYNAGTYNVFGDKVFNNDINVSSSIFDLTWSNDNKNLTATMKTVSDIAEQNGISTDTAIAVAGLTNSSSSALNDLSVKMQENLASGSVADKISVENAVNTLNPEKASVVQSTVTSVQNTVSSLAENRMSGPVLGINGGDIQMVSGGVWVKGLYNKTKMNDSFNGYTRGISVGIDTTMDNNITIGAGYAFNHSDVSPNSRDIDIDSNTLFIYGQYKPTSWYINTVLNYTMADYKESGNALGTPITANYDTDSFGAQLMTGYDVFGGITPELGLRYLHINSETYTNNLGIENKLNSADYLTGILGTKYGFNIITSQNILFRPDLHYAIKYDMISDKSSAIVTMPGVTAYTLNGDRLSRIGGEIGLGLTMKYNELDISLNYDIEFRESYTSQTGMIKARYNF